MMTSSIEDVYKNLWITGLAGVYNKIVKRDTKPLFPSLSEINGWDTEV